MYFFSRWIFIVFEVGGLILVVQFLRKLKKVQAAAVDVISLRKSLWILLAFILLGTASFTDMLTVSFGSLSAQAIANLLTGIAFCFFVRQLSKAVIRPTK